MIAGKPHNDRNEHHGRRHAEQYRLQRDRVPVSQVKQNGYPSVVEGRIQRRHNEKHREHVQEVKFECFPAAQFDRIAKGTNKGNDEKGWVQKEHGKEQDGSKPDEINYRVKGGKGVFHPSPPEFAA
ncbi:hypothetical protein SDC9_57024 [bioreactor metagenome]|uniref:Uncharacterized protein n=1 Tax=bioreactor metagenome TaxID=1076179 RepID=A0A644X3G6_9ZZZZ